MLADGELNRQVEGERWLGAPGDAAWHFDRELQADVVGARPGDLGPRGGLGGIRCEEDTVEALFRREGAGGVFQFQRPVRELMRSRSATWLHRAKAPAGAVEETAGACVARLATLKVASAAGLVSGPFLYP